MLDLTDAIENMYRLLIDALAAPSNCPNVTRGPEEATQD